MAIVYDSFLLIALLFVAEIPTVILNGGTAITRENGMLMFYFLHPMYQLMVSYLFFGWFWVHGGQTLGMKTWRLQLKTSTGENLSWQIAAMRFVGALISWSVFGLGFLWSLLDQRKRSWHDIMSSTVLIQLEKK